MTPEAADARGTEIGEGLAASFTLGAGQFCTKPGLALLPTGPAGDGLRDTLLAAVGGRDFTMLTGSIRDAYRSAVASQDRGATVEPRVREVPATTLGDEPDLLEEVFGPFLVLARYGSTEELRTAVDLLPGALTATVHGEAGEGLAVELARTLPGRVGRLVWNGYPTGVSVGWAQHHGGPWPGTNSLHTSVGASAVRRFLRPVAWQSHPGRPAPGRAPRRPHRRSPAGSTGSCTPRPPPTEQHDESE